MMKQLLRTTGLLLAILIVSAATGRGQTIDLEIQGGTITINDQIISEDALPEDLDIDGVRFGISVHGHESIIVEINGQYYAVTERALEPTDESHDVHVHIRSRSGSGGDGWSYEVIGNDLHGAVSQIGKVDLDDVFLSLAHPLHAAEHVLTELEASWDTLPIEGLFKAYEDLGLAAWQLDQDAAKIKVNYIPHLARMAEVANYFSKMKAADLELYAEVQAEWDLEAELAVLAARIRAMRTGEERRVMVEELRKQLEEAFELKQQNRRREIQQLEEELERLKDRTQERNAARERLIEARLKDLLGTGRNP